MVLEFVYRDLLRNDAYALHSYTRVSCVDGTSKIIECLPEKFRCNEMTVNCREFWSFGCAVIGLKELPRLHPTKRICGMCTRCALLHEYTYGNSLTLFPSSARARVCVCLRHTLTCSVLDQGFFACTVDPRLKCDVNSNKKKEPPNARNTWKSVNWCQKTSVHVHWFKLCACMRHVCVRERPRET